MRKPSSHLQRLLWGTLALINTIIGLFMYGLAIMPGYPDSQLGQWMANAQWDDMPLNKVQSVALVFAIAILYRCLQHAYRTVVERDHRKHYQQWANQHHWSYFPKENPALCQKYRFLRGIPGYYDSPNSPNTYICAIHQFQRQWRNHLAIAYTHYVRRVKKRYSGKLRRVTVTHSYVGITLIHTQHQFPKLYLSPTHRHWSDPICSAICHLCELLIRRLGWNYPEPSYHYYEFQLSHSQSNNQQQQLQNYRIQTTDSRFAQQFLHPKMLKYFATLPKGVKFEIDRDILVIYQKGRLDLEQIEQNLAYLHQIYQLTPKQW